LQKILNQELLNNAILRPSTHIKDSDAEFEMFFKANFSALCNYCQCKFGFDLDQAKEVVQTTFIKLWENRNTLSSELSVKGYLFTIIRNVSYDIFRHNKLKNRYEKHFIENSSIYSKSDFDNIEFNALRNRIDMAISELPDQMRKIFILSRYEGFKYTQIASELNISVKTVETQMSRALVKLRHKLADYLTFYFIIILMIFFK